MEYAIFGVNCIFHYAISYICYQKYSKLWKVFIAALNYS